MLFCREHINHACLVAVESNKITIFEEDYKNQINVCNEKGE